MAVESEPIALGTAAPDFSLPGTDGRVHSLDDASDASGYAVIFTCNHCPYAQAVEGRLIRLGREFGERRVAFFAIMPNDVSRYPDDHPNRMRERAEAKGYPFPYLYDESQDVARAYGAVCTPDIFVFDADRTLRYHGRVDDNWRNPDAATSHELRDALEAIVEGRAPSTEQIPSMGCSIKWKQ